MTKEEKELLLKDLCARAPYEVKCFVSFDDGTTDIMTLKSGLPNSFGRWDFYNENCSGCSNNFKPYLRPMSSMTEEEKDYIKNVARFKQSDGIHYDDGMHYIPIYQETLDDQWKTDGKFPPILDDIYRFMFDYGYTILVDWLNEHHFDYRGLIEKGLALEAPKDMYRIK